MSEIGIGLVGCGGMGKALAKGAIETGIGRVVAVCDKDAERAAEAGQELDAPTLTDSADLLARDDVDVVLVATPNFAHCDCVLEVAQARKPVFCEKPMALSVADCDRMIGACREAGVPLMIGQVLRYYPAFAKAIEIVETGQIGKPFAMHGARMGFARPGGGRASWRESLELSGGPLFEFGVHEIDFIRHICGDPVSVYAGGGNFIHEGQYDYPDLQFVNVNFADGAKGVYANGVASLMPWNEFNIWGTEGALFFSSWSGPLRLHREGEDEQSVEVEGGEPPVQHEMRLFLEAVRDGKPVPIPGEDGRANVAIAEAAHRSLETGQVEATAKPG